MPSKDTVDDMGKELAYKEGIYEAGKYTVARLEAEKEQRRFDLEKIITLDNKINGELVNLRKKIEKMNEEIHGKFNTVDEVKDEFERQKINLQNKKARLSKKLSSIAQLVRNLHVKYETKKSTLADHKEHQKLIEFESKIANNEQNIYGLKSYIDSKFFETNWGPIMNDSKQYVKEINNILVKSVFNY